MRTCCASVTKLLAHVRIFGVVVRFCSAVSQGMQVVVFRSRQQSGSVLLGVGCQEKVPRWQRSARKAFYGRVCSTLSFSVQFCWG